MSGILVLQHIIYLFVKSMMTIFSLITAIVTMVIKFSLETGTGRSTAVTLVSYIVKSA